MGQGDEVVATINEALGQATLLMSKHLFDRTELSPTALDVLYRLHDDGPARLTALASSVDISQPSMTQLIQRLERRGLVVRSADPADRRATLVTLTDGGLSLVDHHEQRVRQQLTEALAALPEADRHALHLAAHVALPILAALIDAAPR